MTEKAKDESLIQIEDAQAAIRGSLERAKELISEAKERMRQQEPNEPPNPAS
jgi:hypothetical protein